MTFGTIRRATLADVDVISKQRAAMFLEIGRATPEIVEPMCRMTREYLLELMPRGEYFGWLASGDKPEHIVAGVGVQVRRVLPFPSSQSDGSVQAAWGAQAIVINVYTEPAFRRRGLALRLMREIIAWASDAKMESLVLHAAPDGVALYEKLGFTRTMEMRLAPGTLGVRPQP